MFLNSVLENTNFIYIKDINSIMSRKNQRREPYYPQPRDEPLDDYDAVPEDRDNRWELDENQILSDLKKELDTRCTPDGVADILGWLRLSLAKTTALSNLSSDEINLFTRRQADAFNFELISKEKKWGISPSDRKTLSEWVTKIIYQHQKRAYKDGERKYRGKAYAHYGESEDEPYTKTNSSLRGLLQPNSREYDDDDQQPTQSVRL